MATAVIENALASATLNYLKQPDVDYTPNFEKYLARTKKRLETENLTKSLPPGFPAKLKSDLVWEGDGLEKTYDIVYELSETEVEEIEQALEYFKSMCLYDS